ncbi:helix-turn-helix transcriptional regulator [Halococcus thailandensis]|uniref:HTH iclR-type domain-containing protein n=1 Tax=Halococcus thailandensis JCM 13552 TaxID=1227457 RepID=M0N9G4_9EURY|nr:hypothetical protein [Halococcus thailandensis]EMA54587.1 hypothetical protein C451_06300 [Halococcus thailandensis JCM 13552]
MTRRTLITLLLAIGVVFCFGGAASAVDHQSDFTVVHSAIATDPAQYAGTSPQQAITVDVRPNGTGVVTVSYHLSLSTVNETTGFRELQENISANPSSYRTRFGARMDRVVASAQAATGRQMTATRPTVSTTRRGSTGVVTYSFLWRNFAASSNDRLRVGDALTGFYLDDGQQLTITWPDGYEPTTVRPSPDSHRTTALQWNASTTFDENEPYVELARTNRSTPNRTGSAEISASSVNSSAESPPSRTTVSSGNQTSSTTDRLQLPLAVGGFVVVLAVLLAILYRRRTQNRETAATEPNGADSGSVGTTDTDESGDSPTALLSNEERVVQVLERAGGRAKQQHVVDELDWTEAKTSQVVKNLRESGTITSFRLGRENVLSLSDEDTNDDEPSTE